MAHQRHDMMRALIDRDSTWVWMAAGLVLLLAAAMAAEVRWPSWMAAAQAEEAFVVPWAGDFDTEDSNGFAPTPVADFGDTRWAARTGAALTTEGAQKLRERATLGGVAECRDMCDRDEECAAAVYARESSRCSLYRTTGLSADVPSAVTLLRVDRPVFYELPRVGLQTAEPLAGSEVTRDRDACRRLCASTPGCVAATHSARPGGKCDMLRSVRGLIAPVTSETHSYVRAS